jgi:hypothetical protein
MRCDLVGAPPAVEFRPEFASVNTDSLKTTGCESALVGAKPEMHRRYLWARRKPIAVPAQPVPARRSRLF